MASPVKPSQRHQSPTQTTSMTMQQQSPDKASSSQYAAENARMEDPSYRSPPQKKFTSSMRPNATGSSKTGSPAKVVAPFGKPIEIIKSKLLRISILLRVLIKIKSSSLCLATLLISLSVMLS